MKRILDLKFYFRCLTVLGLLVVTGFSGFAASRDHRRVKVVEPAQVSSVDVTISEGKKSKIYTIQCLANVPGQTRAAKNDKLTFKPFSDLIKNARSNKELIRFRALKQKGAQACKSSTVPKTPGVPENPKTGIPAPSTPTATPAPSSPEFLSLDPYQGPFTEKEARIVINRFAFGGNPAQVAEAVQLGLVGLANKLTTYVPEPAIDQIYDDVARDSWLTGDPDAGDQNKTTSPALNDLSRSGTRIALMMRMQKSVNPFFERFKFWLHDERLSVSQSAARDCELHAIREYVDDLQRSSISGDYRAYMRAMNNSHLMHLRWLDGASNQGGVVTNRPNENWGREFWELGTVSPTNLDKLATYTDLDVAQGAIAFTGWSIDQITVDNAQVCLASRVPLLHTPGNKVIFNGTPYQSTVDNDEDMLTATLNHPRAAEHLAEDIWKQFINDRSTPDSIRALAKLIRDSNYNLLPVFRTVMTSKAMFAAESRNALIRHPIDRVIGFLRISGFPLYYRQFDNLMATLEERPLDPPTVFGWDEKRLIDDSRMLSWKNAIMDYFVNINIKDVKTKLNWSYYDRFVKDLNDQGKKTSSDVINRVAKEFGIELNDAQKAKLDEYMNYYVTSYNCPAQCNGQPYRAVRLAYDTSPDSDESGLEYNGQRRIRGLIALMLSLDGFLTK